MMTFTESELKDTVSFLQCRTGVPVKVVEYRCQDGHRVADVLTNNRYRQSVVIAED